MGLLIRIGLLAVLFCALAVELGAGQSYNEIMEGGGGSKPRRVSRPRSRPVVSPRRKPYAPPRAVAGGARPTAGAPRRPAASRGPARRPAAGSRRPRNKRPRVAAVRKPKYGQAQIAPSGNKPGNYQYAQASQKRPVQRAVQRRVQRPTQRPALQTPAVKSQNAMAVSMPTLANLLYQYAAKSAKPIYVQNPYQSLFGTKSYGPMPKPTGYTQQHRQQAVSYQTRPQAPVQQPARPVYRPVAPPQPQPYVTPAPTPSPPVQYYQPAPQPQPQPRPVVYQPRYPAPAPAPVPAPVPAPTHAPAPAPTYAPAPVVQR